MKPSRDGSNPELRQTIRLLGQRLKQLRKQAGLTQTELGRKLARTGPFRKAHVSKIERGDVVGLGLDTVLEWLQQCGVKTESIVDVLDRYTGLPTPAEVEAARAITDAGAGLPIRRQAQLQRYDLARSYKLNRRVPTESELTVRVKAGTGQARALIRDRLLHRLFNDELNALRLAWSDTQAVFLRRYGRMVFSALRKGRKRSAAWKEKRQAELDAWPAASDLAPGPFRRIKQAVTDLFTKLDLAGKLD